MQHVIYSPLQLAHILKSARKIRGWTQAELAARLPVSQGRLSQLELHPASMRTDQLLVLLASLNLELVVQEKWPPDPLGPNDW